MKYCYRCGKTLPDDALVCSACGKRQEDVYSDIFSSSPPSAPSATSPKDKKPKKSLKRIFWRAFLFSFPIFIVIFIGGFFTNWYGFYTPMDKLLNALENTMKAESFTLTITSTTTDKEEQDDLPNGFLMVELHPDAQELTYLLNDTASGEATLIVDGIKYQLDGTHSSKKDYDSEEFFKSYNALLEEKDPNWNKFLVENELDEGINTEHLDEFFHSLYSDLLKDKNWQQKALGFEYKNNTYTFHPNYTLMVNDVLDLGKSCGIFTAEAKKELREEQTSLDKDLKRIDQSNLNISLTLKDGYLSTVTIEQTVENETVVLELTLSNVNKTKIDQKTITEITSSVEQAIKRDRCTSCGKRRYGKQICTNCNPNYCSSCYTALDPSMATQYQGKLYHFKCCDTLCVKCNRWRLPKSIMYLTQYGYVCSDCYF